MCAVGEREVLRVEDRVGVQRRLDPVGQVVRRTERASAAVGGDAERALTCLAGDAAQCAIAPVCRLRGALDEALQAFYRVLDRYTLADLVLQRDALPPLPGIALPAPARASVAARAAS